MGNLYDPGPEEKSEWCQTTNSDDGERMIVEIDGTPRRETWKPIRVKLLKKTLRQKLQYSDSPWGGSNSLVFRRPAIEKMKPIFDACGELLPLECPDAELWVFNPTIVLDALDETASVGTLSTAGYLILIEKYVFHADMVAGVDMFKLKNRRASRTFVSDRFVNLWNASGLKGLRFDKVWSSD